MLSEASMRLKKNAVEIISRYCFNYKTNSDLYRYPVYTQRFSSYFASLLSVSQTRWDSKQRRTEEWKEVELVNKCFMLSSNMCFFTKYQTFTHVLFAVERFGFLFWLKPMKNVFLVKNIREEKKWKSGLELWERFIFSSFPCWCLGPFPHMPNPT